MRRARAVVSMVLLAAATSCALETGRTERTDPAPPPLADGRYSGWVETLDTSGPSLTLTLYRSFETDDGPVLAPTGETQKLSIAPAATYHAFPAPDDGDPSTCWSQGDPSRMDRLPISDLAARLSRPADACRLVLVTVRGGVVVEIEQYWAP